MVEGTSGTYTAWLDSEKYPITVRPSVVSTKVLLDRPSYWRALRARKAFRAGLPQSKRERSCLFEIGSRITGEVVGYRARSNGASSPSGFMAGTTRGGSSSHWRKSSATRDSIVVTRWAARRAWARSIAGMRTKSVTDAPARAAASLSACFCSSEIRKSIRLVFSMVGFSRLGILNPLDVRT